MASWCIILSIYFAIYFLRSCVDSVVVVSNLPHSGYYAKQEQQ